MASLFRLVTCALIGAALVIAIDRLAPLKENNLLWTLLLDKGSYPYPRQGARV